MKAGWEAVRLADVCTFRPPKSEARKKLAEADMVSFAPMEDLGIDQKYLEPSGVRPLDSVAGSYTYFADGDVLLAKITPCFENGKLGIARDLENGIGFGSSEYFVIRPSSRVTAEYLYYFLSQPSFREAGAQSMTGAVGHKRVAKDFLEELALPLPPHPEQQRIVAILDEAFAGIATARAAAEQNRQNARALFENHLQSVFSQRGEGWVEKPMCEVATILNGYAFKSGDFSSDGATKSIKITNVGVREFVETSDSSLPADFAEKFASVAAPAGSLVIALTRTIIADGLKVAVVPPAYDRALVNQRVAALLPKPDEVSASYLFAYLSTSIVLNYVKARVNTLMQPNLSINDLRAMPIPLPPVSERECIIDRLSALEEETQHLEALYQRKLEALDELKQSLLQQAFSGNL